MARLPAPPTGELVVIIIIIIIRSSQRPLPLPQSSNAILHGKNGAGSSGNVVNSDAFTSLKTRSR